MTPLLTPSDLRRELGVNIETARRLMATGSIRSINIGTGIREHWRTTREAVDAWRQAIEPASVPTVARKATSQRLPKPNTQKSNTNLRPGGYRDWFPNG